ncbi:hypothetical protein R1sor_003533 [Riccia sorocarpa]|uniref:Reverse transcriptase n=1 Tax=Riccia sorocarpa TaxID=122646 RepID=A0ABD3H5Y9_9MARC
MQDKLTNRTMSCIVQAHCKNSNRVEHQFLKDTMTALGFSNKFLNLVFDLTNNSEAKVHINASEDFFNRVKWVVKRFENISGALLNLSKSVVIPFAMTDTPQWLKKSGCVREKDRELITYLGSFGRIKMTEDQIVVALLEKLNRKINQWSSRLLTWSDRICLLKNASKAIPNYTFPALGLSKDDYTQLENICRSFLWAILSPSALHLAIINGLCPDPGMQVYLLSFQAILSKVNTDASKLEDSPSWHWQVSQQLKSGGSHSSRTWREILDPSSAHDNSWQQ